ncbi:hypothetical protein ACA910_003870 [Epithemia clementina (nom. ined.)]
MNDTTVITADPDQAQQHQPPPCSDEDINTSMAHLCQWVDYLPNQCTRADDKNVGGSSSNNEKDPLAKRLSMDPSETNITETNDSMDMEDWPDSSSLEGYSMLPPAMLLGDDPIIQQELLLDSSVVGGSSICNEDPSVAPEMFANSLEELLEQRRNQLAAYMQASMRTRQFLEPHIRQRAGLATILTQIERSSITIQEHLLHKNNQHQQQQQIVVSDDSAAASIVGSDIHDNKDVISDGSNHSVDMTGIDMEDEDVEDFAASVLADDADCLL